MRDYLEILDTIVVFATILVIDHQMRINREVWAKEAASHNPVDRAMLASLVKEAVSSNVRIAIGLVAPGALDASIRAYLTRGHDRPSPGASRLHPNLSWQCLHFPAVFEAELVAFARCQLSLATITYGGCADACGIRCMLHGCMSLPSRFIVCLGQNCLAQWLCSRKQVHEVVLPILRQGGILQVIDAIVTFVPINMVDDMLQAWRCSKKSKSN